MNWQPWPGHPCEGHACDGCAVCRAGLCCLSPGAHLQVDSLAVPNLDLAQIVAAEAGSPRRPRLADVIRAEVTRDEGSVHLLAPGPAQVVPPDALPSIKKEFT